MNTIKLKFMGLSSILTSFVSAATVMAVGETPPGNVPNVTTITKAADILTIVTNVTNWTFAFFFAFAAFFFLWSGFDYLTAAGDATKVTAAKNRLIYAIVGVAVALIAKSIPALVENFIK